jgi:hypothetical protein
MSSESALKAWATRRATAAKKQADAEVKAAVRSEAARKAWVTRKANVN